MALWLGCHTTEFHQWSWPDGEALLEQPALAVEVFDFVRAAMIKESEAKR